MSKRKKNKRGKNVEVKNDNAWTFLIVLTKAFFQLINNNKIYPLVLLIFTLVVALVVWKIPDTELANIVQLLLEKQLSGINATLAILLFFTNIMWIYLLKRLRSIYTDEIDRLASQRSKLFHGDSDDGGSGSAGGKPAIEKHRSSADKCGEKYILPSRD